MLNHPTLDQLKTLKLDGMAEAFNELETQDGCPTRLWKPSMKPTPSVAVQSVSNSFFHSV